MFTDFQRVWTPVLLRRELGKKPVDVQIAGEHVVLFRDRTGQARALANRCPHRGVKLSFGRVNQDGHIVCGFHGWEFAAQGQCVRVPFNPTAKCHRLGVPAFPTYEGGGLIWLYTAVDTGQRVDPPRVPESLRNAHRDVFSLETTWETHWTRVMENMMDTAHVPYVHHRTIGRILNRLLKRDTRMEVDVRPTADGMFITGIQDGRHLVGMHEFIRPNAMVLWVDGPSGHVRIQVYCIPVNPTRTRLLIIGYFGWRNLIAKLFLGLNRYVVQEDRAIVESSQPVEAPHPSVENCVVTDRGTLLFRKYYYEVLKDRQDSSVAAVADRPALRITG